MGAGLSGGGVYPGQYPLAGGGVCRGEAGVCGGVGAVDVEP